MNYKKLLYISLLIFSIPVAAQKYHVKSYHHERLTVDSRYDKSPDAEATAFLAPFKHEVDSINSPVVGHCARSLSSERPESEMGDLLADILIWSGMEEFKDTADFAIYNIGGVRATFTKGEINIGNVVDVAPFENKICFVTLKGSDVIDLFKQIAHRKGEGVSSSVRCTITKDGQLSSLTINGKEVDPEADYRVATIDYLLDGNDGLSVIGRGTNIVAPKEERNDTRFIIMDYFRAKEKAGEAVDVESGERIVVLDN